MSETILKKSNVLTRFRRFARSNGLGLAILVSISRVASFHIWRRWFQLSIVHVYSAPLSAIRTASRLPSAYTIRPAEVDDFDELAEYCGNTDGVRERIDRGDICVLNLCANKIGAMIWLRLGPNAFSEDWSTLNCHVRLPDRAAWMFDGKGTIMGAWSGLMMTLPKYLAERGIDEVYTMIDFDNRKSIDPMLSLGLRQVGSYLFVKLLGLKFSRCRDIAEKRWQRLPMSLGRLEVTKEL